MNKQGTPALKPSVEIGQTVYLIAKVYQSLPSPLDGHRKTLDREVLVVRLVGHGVPTLTARKAVDYAHKQQILQCRYGSTAMQETITLAQVALGEYRHLLGEPPAIHDTSKVRAHQKPIFVDGVPKDQDIADLAVLLQTEHGKPKDQQRSDNRVALEFTKETNIKSSKARRLLNRIRNDRSKGKINL